jgi:hypothetical protein
VSVGADRETRLAASARDRLLRWTPLSVRRRWWYLLNCRRWLRLRRPVRFSEKVNWRIVNDHRPVLLGTCDKLAMKAFAVEHAGDLPLRVPRTCWAGTDIGELAAVDLPAEWVLKPNHRSGTVVFGSGAPDIADLRERTSGWLEEMNWAILGEWAYRRAARLIVAEERIGGSAPVPADYKVFVFDGVPRMIQVDLDRHTRPSRRFYTADWVPLPHSSRFTIAEPQPSPPELALLLEISARIGRPFDYMRVDLYLHDGEVWFGELTPYPGGGLVPFEPSDLDVTLGGYWQLPAITR